MRGNMRTNEYRNNNVGDAVFNASRQVWLASLGAAVVSREWAQAEAGNVFRTLVKEGTLVESRAIRMVGDRIEGSFTMANSIWKSARQTVQATVRQAADTAVTLVQSKLPRTILPAKLAQPKAKPAKKRAAKTVRAVKTAKRGSRRTKARTAK